MSADPDTFYYASDYTLELETDEGQALRRYGFLRWHAVWPPRHQPGHDHFQAATARTTIIFPISVTQDDTDPIAVAQSYQDGVGGELEGSRARACWTTTPARATAACTSPRWTAPTDTTVSTTGGTLTWSSDGSFTYTPNTGIPHSGTYSKRRTGKRS